jgi:hypothetical protein
VVCSMAVDLNQSRPGWRVGDGRRPSLALLERTDPVSRMVEQAACRVVEFGTGRGKMWMKDVGERCQWVRMI